jgi:hypothetical protein
MKRVNRDVAVVCISGTSDSSPSTRSSIKIVSLSEIGLDMPVFRPQSFDLGTDATYRTE